jgi:hypothetical protein
MSISKDLFLAILSLDSYNQGYGQGLEHGKSQIGAAKFDDDRADLDAQAAGLYAVSYEIGEGVEGIDPGTTVISYRGTDSLKG